MSTLTLNERMTIAIRYERGCQQITLNHLAALASIPRDTLVRIEAGAQSLSLDRFEAIAEALDLSPRELLQLAEVAHELPKPTDLRRIYSGKRGAAAHTPTQTPAP